MIPPQRRREGPDSRSLAQGGKDRWLQSCRKDFVLGRGLEGFLQIRTSLVGRLTLTNDVNVETTPDVPGILVSDRLRSPRAHRTGRLGLLKLWLPPLLTRETVLRGWNHAPKVPRRVQA